MDLKLGILVSDVKVYTYEPGGAKNSISSFLHTPFERITQHHSNNIPYVHVLQGSNCSLCCTIGLCLVSPSLILMISNFCRRAV